MGVQYLEGNSAFKRFHLIQRDSSQQAKDYPELMGFANERYHVYILSKNNFSKQDTEKLENKRKMERDLKKYTTQQSHEM